MAPSLSTLRPSKDFVLGVVATFTLLAVHKLYHLLDEPSLAEMEARATASVGTLASDARKGSKNTTNNNEDDGTSAVTIFGFDAPGEHADFERGVLDASPYVMYVEMACRIMGQHKYKKVKAIPVEWRFRPRHKLPVAIVPLSRTKDVDGDISPNGPAMLDDSRKIVNAIVRSRRMSDTGKKNYLDDASLTNEQKAMARLIENTLTQSLFWSMAYNKWATQRGREAFRRILAQPTPSDNKALPALARPFIASMAFRHMDAQLMGHGIARCPRQEVLQKARQDIAALSQIIGTNDYILGGSVPSFTDALLYAMLVLAFEDRELQVDLNSTKEEYSNLAAYVERMKQRYIPELEMT